MMPMVNTAMAAAFTIPAKYRDGTMQINATMSGMNHSDGFAKYLSATRRKSKLVEINRY